MIFYEPRYAVRFIWKGCGENGAPVRKNDVVSGNIRKLSEWHVGMSDLTGKRVFRVPKGFWHIMC